MATVRRKKRAPACVVNGIVFRSAMAFFTTGSSARIVSWRTKSRYRSVGFSTAASTTSTASGRVKKLAARTASSRTRGCPSAASLRKRSSASGTRSRQWHSTRVAAARAR